MPAGKIAKVLSRSERLKKLFNLSDDGLKSLRTELRKGISSKKRVGTTGQFSGAPEGMDTPQKILAQRENYLITMGEGAAGRNWYHDASRWIRESAPEYQPHIVRDPKELLSRTLGRTSAGAGVDPNTMWGIKGYNQSLLGDPINTGRFPTATAKDIETWIESGQSFGYKTDPFTLNLHIDWDPSLGKRPVHDIWDGRAWGYKGPGGKPWDAGFGIAQHRHMDEESEAVTRVANQFRLSGAEDWDHMRSQAAAWTGEKIRAGELSAEDAAKHFGDYAKQDLVDMTRETVPGSNTQHLQGLIDADFDLKQLYHDEVNKIIYPQGRDVISDAYGLLQESVNPGIGIYERQINPGTVVSVYGGRTLSPVGNKELGLLDPSSHKLIENAQDAYSWLTAQKGSAINKPLIGKGVTQNLSNMIDFSAGRNLSLDEMTSLHKEMLQEFGPELMDNGISLIMSNDGARVLNLTEADWWQGPKISGKDFSKRVKSAYERSVAPDATGRVAYASTSYKENPWDLPGGRYGQSYLEGMEGGGHIQASFESVVPGLSEKLSELDRRFAKEFPELGPPSSYIQMARKAVAEKGLAGLNHLIRTGELPEVVGASLIPIITGAGLASQADEAEAGMKSKLIKATLRKADEINDVNFSHRYQHTAPSRDGAPLNDLTQVYPDDIYSPMGRRYYGHGGAEDIESFDSILKARGNPDAEITVYRAVPTSAPDEIYSGDWVTTSKKYAKQHGEGFDESKILTAKVKAKDLFTDGNSPLEYGWQGAATLAAGIALASQTDEAAAMQELSDARREALQNFIERRTSKSTPYKDAMARQALREVEDRLNRDRSLAGIDPAELGHNMLQGWVSGSNAMVGELSNFITNPSLATGVLLKRILDGYMTSDYPMPPMNQMAESMYQRAEETVPEESDNPYVNFMSGASRFVPWMMSPY